MYNNYSIKCGKLSFSDKYEADAKIEQREFDDPSWEGRSYQCSKCSNWHITTRSEEEYSPEHTKFKKNKTRNQSSKNTVEGSRVVNSFGENSFQKAKIMDSIDKDTLKKLSEM